MAADVPAALVEKAARAMWNAQIRQPWQQIDDGDEWPSWVDLATRDRLREKVRHALAAVLPEIQAQALRDALPIIEVSGPFAYAAVEEMAARLTDTTEEAC